MKTESAALAEQMWSSELELPPQPDSRFLWAVSGIAQFFSGSQNACQAKAEFESPAWTVRCGPRLVGRLVARPDFSDMRQLLISWAEKSSFDLTPGEEASLPSKSLKSIDSQLENFKPPSLITALQDLNRLWGQGSRQPILLERVARALVLLTLQSGGLEGLNDPLEGRALAMLVLAGEGYGLQNVEAEEALLAHHLGYQGHALQAATQLPADHAVRLYLQGSLQALRQAAEQASPKTPLIRYLYLKRLAQSGLGQDWAYWADRHFPSLQMALPVLNSRPQSETASVSHWERILDLSRAELARAADDLNPGLENLFPRRPAVAQDWAIERIRPMLWQGGQVSPQEFETLLQSLESLYTGPFLDGADLRGFFASPFYTALYRLADQSARQNACSSDFPLDSPFPLLAFSQEQAVQLQAWYQQQARTNASAAAPRLSVASPDATRQFESLDELVTLLPYHDRRLVALIREMSGRLDSRPAHREAQCRWRSSLGLKALAEGYRSQAAEWFEGLPTEGCGPLAPTPRMARMIRQGVLLSPQTAQAEE